jgi:hypothetical protein
MSKREREREREREKEALVECDNWSDANKTNETDKLNDIEADEGR